MHYDFAPQGPGRPAAGTLVTDTQLTQMSAQMSAIDAGDRIVKGRIELYACSRRRLRPNEALELERSASGGSSCSDSPLGPLASDSAQILLCNLRALMSLLWVDYDCSRLRPEDFERCPNKHAVFSAVNHSLVDVVDRMHAGFHVAFWQVVASSFDAAGAEVYAFKPASGGFGPTDNALMSFHYFFVDWQNRQILFIGSVTKSRGRCRGGVDSDSDVVLSGESASSVKSKSQTSSDREDLADGEFAFSDGSGDGMMD